MHPHGQVWISHGEIISDVGNPPHHPHIIWGHRSDEVRSPLQCFKLAFPMDKLAGYITATNDFASTIRDPDTQKSSEVEIKEADLFKYFAVRLVHSLEGTSTPISECWKLNPIPNSLAEPRGYRQRFKMSKNRFNFITRAFRVFNFNDESLSEVSYFACYFNIFYYINKEIVIIYIYLGSLVTYSIIFR